MSKVIRLLLQIPLFLLMLLSLSLFIGMSASGKLSESLLFLIMTFIAAGSIWVAGLIGNPKVQDEEWKKGVVATINKWYKPIIVSIALLKALELYISRTL